MNHKYMRKKVGRQASRAHAEFGSKIFLLKNKLGPEAAGAIAAPRTPVSRSDHSHLPELKHPVFKGTYKEWPGFSSLFRSILDKEARLRDLERFHYLQSSVKEEAADLIADLPMEEKSYTIGWRILKVRYDNK